MITIDFNELAIEIIGILAKEQSLVLATSHGNHVTARTMSHVNDGTTVYFQTGGASEKFEQIKHNPNIAFAVGNMQIEAVSVSCGHPRNSIFFTDLYKHKYPKYYELYSSNIDEVVIKAVPTKITLYKYVDGIPCRDILNIRDKKAYRE